MVKQIECCSCGSVVEAQITTHPLSWSPTGVMHFASCPLCNTFLEVFKPKNLHDLWHSELANGEV